MTALRPLADSKGLEFDKVCQDSDLTVLADRRALSQILLNLASNAVKFTERGFVRIEVVHHGDAESVTEFSVIDTGPGIPANDQSRLFEAFSRIDASKARRTEGTGLGLHLSQKLAELLGGRIAVQSEVGKGSRFTLTLSRRQKTPQEGPLSPASRRT